MTGHIVGSAILRGASVKILIEQVLAPSGLFLPGEDGLKGKAVNGLRDSQASDPDQGRGQVDILHKGVYPGARLDDFGPAHEQGRFEAFLIHPALFRPAVLTSKKSLIGTGDDQGVFSKPALIKKGKESSDLIIQSVNAPDIVLDEPLIYVKLARFAFQFARFLHFAEFEVSGGGFVATGENQEAVETMFEWVRTRIGFYGSTPSYWPVLEAHDLKDLGLKLNDLSKKGLWDQMANEISDDVVHLFSAVGRHEELPKVIE